jgi:hypothetical protein
MTSYLKPRTNLCEDGNGNVIADVKQIKSIWEEYFEDLYNPIEMAGERSHFKDMTEQDEVVEEPSDLQETNKAIQKLKSNMAPGIDNIHTEIYKVGGNILKLEILALIMKIWEDECVLKTDDRL